MNVLEIIKTTDMSVMLPTLEKEMLKYEQAQCPVIHHFSPGLYVREVNIPAGTFAIGYRQKKEHLNVFLKGKVVMLNDNGTVTELVAPMIFTGKPGRKAGYISEDMVWLNVYPTEETDVATLEDTYLDKSGHWEKVQSDKLPKLIDQEDYKRVLEEYGYDEETVRSQSENEEDQIPFPPGSYSVAVFPSNIEAFGLFATAPFKEGDTICPAGLDGMRTPAGRFTNHSKRPNAKMQRIGNDVYLVAIKDINGCTGGKIGDEITVDYRRSMQIEERVR